MPEAVLDVVTGLIAAIVSGTAVWLWQRGRRTRSRRGKARFFGLRNGQECLVVMNRHYASVRAVARSDVYALLEVGSLAEELGCVLSVESSDELREGVGDRTEFCIGGPDSNSRTAAHLASFLPGVTFIPFAQVGSQVEITAGDRRFVREPDTHEYALVAKFLPPDTTHPVILICGQTAITNRAAMHFLRRHYQALASSLDDTERFALIVKITSPDVYGHKLVELDADVTDPAFTRRPLIAEPGDDGVEDPQPQPGPR